MFIKTQNSKIEQEVYCEKLVLEYGETPTNVNNL